MPPSRRFIMFAALAASLMVAEACKGGAPPVTSASEGATAEPKKAAPGVMGASVGSAGPSAMAVRTSGVRPPAALPAIVIDHTVSDIEGSEVALEAFRGKALLIVNTASQCGYTPQYEGLQKLHERYADRGLTVLGFPSNDFGGQEPGSEAEIQAFVRDTYGVDFPMFGKLAVKGEAKSGLYKTLTEETADGIRGEVKWNFTKFLVDAEGKVVARFGSGVDPLADELTAAVEKVLPE